MYDRREKKKYLNRKSLPGFQVVVILCNNLIKMLSYGVRLNIKSTSVTSTLKPVERTRLEKVPTLLGIVTQVPFYTKVFQSFFLLKI